MISVFDNLDNLEEALLRSVAPAFAHVDLKPMLWETAGAEVYVPLWQKHVAESVHLLAGITVASLPKILKDPGLSRPKSPILQACCLLRRKRAERAATLLQCALTLALLEHAWNLQIQPGQFSVQRDDFSLQPPVIVTKLRSGELSDLGWSTYCSTAGIVTGHSISSVFFRMRATCRCPPRRRWWAVVRIVLISGRPAQHENSMCETHGPGSQFQHLICHLWPLVTFRKLEERWSMATTRWGDGKQLPITPDNARLHGWKRPPKPKYHPRPMKGIAVAITVMNSTFASSGRLAM